MLNLILLLITASAGGYFAFQYFSLLFAFKRIVRELDDIQKDLSQNQLLHSPIPNRHLKRLLAAFNASLESIQAERQKYEKREKVFQQQIANISHDLRTPLTVILGYLKLLKKEELPTPSAGTKSEGSVLETLNIIEQKATVMSHLVSQFYDFSRLDAGEYKLSLEKIDLCRILKESLMGNSEILEQANLSLDIDLPAHPVWAAGDVSALERIFLNLFQNAGRYASTCLRIAIEERDSEVLVTFANDTTLLSKSDIPRLFDRFYMQDSARNQGGTGLGLTVARSLAQKMGARLEVRCEELGECSDGMGEMLEVCFLLQMNRPLSE